MYEPKRGFLAFQPLFQRKLKKPDVGGTDSSMGGRFTEQEKIGLDEALSRDRPLQSLLWTQKQVINGVESEGVTSWVE